MTSVRLNNGRILPSCCVALIKDSSAPDLVELKVLSMVSNEFWKQVGKAVTRERGRVLSRFIRLMDRSVHKRLFFSLKLKYIIIV